MAFVSWLLSHKLLLLFIAATAAFTISTIVLAVDNNNLRSELDEQQNSEETSPTTESSTTTEAPADMTKYRLPSTAKPSVYDLYLYPDLQTGDFSGKIIIDLEVLEATNAIVLHSNLLTIDSVSYGDGNAATATLDADYELLEIRRADGLQFSPGQENVTIEFSGDMKNRIVGLYTSSYTDDRGDR